jgi:hypothetical protein
VPTVIGDGLVSKNRTSSHRELIFELANATVVNPGYARYPHTYPPSFLSAPKKEYECVRGRHSQEEF